MSTSQAQKAAHKLMRRGTRACKECRRRKIKCIYDDGRDDICQECVTHSRVCIPQGKIRSDPSAKSSRSVRVQVARLETAVQKLARERVAPRKISTDETQDASTSTKPGSRLPQSQSLQKQSPVFQSFDNDTIRQNGIHEAYGNELKSVLAFIDPEMSDREKLLSTIANAPNILDVIENSSDWWISWREQHFALRKSVGTNSLRNFVQVKLADSSCVAVAMGLLAIAVALSHLRVGIDDVAFSLPVPATDLISHILAAVDQIICDSPTYHAETDIILLFMMRAKHHTENNQLRKAWMRIRQAIHCAQAMNFGAMCPTDGVMSAEEAEQQRFIASIFEIDHLISMVLGFPRATDAAFTDARAFSVLLDPTVSDESLKMRALRRIVAVMAGHVNDRNASGEIIDELTEGSQQTLELAASQMPNGWWQLLEQSMSGTAQHRYESLMVQTWYWTVQTYLNMPYLINPTNTPTGQRFRHLCLDGTRNLIRTFNYLRSEPSISVYMCNCDDFQGLLAGVNLLVGILQDAAASVQTPSSGETNMYSPDSLTPPFMKIDADLALIEELKDVFRYRMHEQGGGISKQGLQVLNELTSFIYDDDEPVSNLDGSEQVLSGIGIDVNKRQKTIMLPYFGTISIELVKRIPRRQSTQNYVQHRLPTPPQTSDDSIAYFPYDQQADYLTPNPTGLTDGYPDSSWSDNTSSYTNWNYSPQSEHECLQSAQSGGHISFECWKMFMNDRELSQCWNPDLYCPTENL